MAAGANFSIRFPADLRAAVDTASDGNRSGWLADAARARLAGDITDPVDHLMALAPQIAAYLETCPMDERDRLRDPLNTMAKAYSARSTNGRR